MFDLSAFVSKINLFRQASQRRFVGQVLERTVETGNDEKGARCVRNFLSRSTLPFDP